jgi:2-(1,2-epoxy-1,2-dihydrophenyl)acetyl-CoA isomerase
MSRHEIETGTQTCQAYVDDGVAVITLNRPAARNALSKPMLDALEATLEHAERTPDIRVVVVTGAGKAFCAGGDVKSMAAGGASEFTLDERIHLQRLSQRNTAGRMHLMPKPVIAALPGAAAGAGLSIALAADLRVMADTAFITTAFAKVGYSGDFGGSYFLSQLVGQGKAREMYFLSSRVDAAQCLELGIANRVVAAAELLEQTMTLARQLAAGPPIAYRYMKENFNRVAQGANVIECLDLEATHHVHTGLSQDHKNAAQAFVDKREPVFNGT